MVTCRLSNGKQHWSGNVSHCEFLITLTVRTSKLAVQWINLSSYLCDCFRTLGADRCHRQTPLPALALRSMVQMLDPLNVADLVLRAVMLTGFTCLFRPNSYQSLRWRHVTFEAHVDEEGNLHVEVVLAVPDSKSVGYAAAIGGLGRSVKLKEFEVRDLCVVRTLVALAVKIGVLDLDLTEACRKQRFAVKPECLDFFVFPVVEGGVLTPHKTVRWVGGGVVYVLVYSPNTSCHPCFAPPLNRTPTTHTSLFSSIVVPLGCEVASAARLTSSTWVVEGSGHQIWLAQFQVRSCRPGHYQPHVSEWRGTEVLPLSGHSACPRTRLSNTCDVGVLHWSSRESSL